MDLLESNAKDSLIVANWCINALYERNPIVFTEKILNRITAPLLAVPEETKPLKVVKTEIEVTKCIQTLSKCFLNSGAKFKCLPIKLLAVIAVPLFRLYNKSYRTIYIHRNVVQQLLLLLLTEQTLQEDLFRKFLDQNSSSIGCDYGNSLTFRIGTNGEFEIINQVEDLGCEEFGDCLLSLVQTDKKLSYNLFCYLLKSLSSFDKERTKNIRNFITSDDEKNLSDMHSIEIRLVYTKLLSILAETSAIQEAHVKNPEHILSFIKSLIKEQSQENTTEFDVLYISLMLIKVILTNKRRTDLEWKSFDELVTSLDELQGLNTQSELLSLAKEVETLIKTRGASARPQYQDLSETNQEATEFDKALRDLADPLLPVRAHGLMSLTKLIERSDPDAVAKRDIILCLFQVRQLNLSIIKQYFINNYSSMFRQ